MLPGLADHLAGYVGGHIGFSQREGRYSAFLLSGLPWATTFRLAWGHMRAETGATPGSIFEAEARDAPGTPPPEDDDPRHDDGKMRLQRLCTRARFRHRHTGVAARMLLLRRGDPRRVAWDAQIPGAAFTTLPTVSLRASGQEFCSVVAMYMGIPDPLLAQHEGTVFMDRASKSGSVRRTIDVYGRALSLYMGRDHWRFRFHNELEDAGLSLASLVGFNAQQQPHDVFTSAITLAQRQRFEGRQRQAAKVHRGGLIADMAIRGFYLPNAEGVVPVLRQYDWKTVGYNPKFYPKPDRAPDLRAAKVPGEYESRARAVDFEYNGVPRT